ncbi:MAG TPA: hypothetical protein VKV39_16670 [Candidatus Sulfotelmatobacter sp.]|nr:hypothetical protein [Candidatus Sulfotelmatobacter sp.]
MRKVRLAGRVARDMAGRSRTLNAILSGVKATTRSFMHAGHMLWLEVTGTLFLSIAAFGIVALVREYMKYQAGQVPGGRVGIIFAFTVTFGWFGVSSFWRVRRKGQRQ